MKKSDDPFNLIFCEAMADDEGPYLTQCYKCLAYFKKDKHTCSDVLVMLVTEARNSGRLMEIDKRFKKKS